MILLVTSEAIIQTMSVYTWTGLVLFHKSLSSKERKLSKIEFSAMHGRVGQFNTKLYNIRPIYKHVVAHK